MKVPFEIYADFEALVRKIPGCERGPESKQQSFTEKTEWHEACGFSYFVVRSDGWASQPVVYRGKNAVGTFLRAILQVEKETRKSLNAPKPIVMTPEDWEKFKNATNCHVCNKPLIKDQFLDSLPAWGPKPQKMFLRGTEKMGFYHAKKINRRKRPDGIKQSEKLYILRIPTSSKKLQRRCIYVKDHCHFTGRFRGAAHNSCNMKLQIKPNTVPIPVVFHNLRGYCY